MAVRILTYVGLLYQDLIKRKQLPEYEKLPPVLPVVLYNGNRLWNAAQPILELLPAGYWGGRIFATETLEAFF